MPGTRQLEVVEWGLSGFRSSQESWCQLIYNATIAIAGTEKHSSLTAPVLRLLMLGGQAFLEGVIPYVYW
jgi:hypothetical protein